MDTLLAVGPKYYIIYSFQNTVAYCMVANGSGLVLVGHLTNVVAYLEDKCTCTCTFSLQKYRCMSFKSGHSLEYISMEKLPLRKLS